MISGIRRTIAGLAACLVVATSIMLGTASPAAAAFGDETFGCRVAPGTDLQWRSFCRSTMAAQQYNAGFAVLDSAGLPPSGYTYSWSINGQYSHVITGCTSASAGCALATSQGDIVSVTVTYSQGGQSITKSATAVIHQYCGGQLC